VFFKGRRVGKLRVQGNFSNRKNNIFTWIFGKTLV
jgi:hypothetical protein